MDDVIDASATALATGDGRAWVRRLLAQAGTTAVHPWLAANLSQSQDMAVAAFTEPSEDLDQFRSAMLAFMERYDVILCPVNAWPALPHDTWRDAFRSGSPTAPPTDGG